MTQDGIFTSSRYEIGSFGRLPRWIVQPDLIEWDLQAERSSAACGNNSANLPAAHKCIPLERQHVNRVRDQVVFHIEIAHSLVPRQIVGIGSGLCQAVGRFQSEATDP